MRLRLRALGLMALSLTAAYPDCGSVRTVRDSGRPKRCGDMAWDGHLGSEAAGFPASFAVRTRYVIQPLVFRVRSAISMAKARSRSPMGCGFEKR